MKKTSISISFLHNSRTPTSSNLSLSQISEFKFLLTI